MELRPILLCILLLQGPGALGQQPVICSCVEVAANDPPVRARLKGHTDQVFCLAFGPDRKTLASGCQDATIRLWDLASGKTKATLQGSAGHRGRFLRRRTDSRFDPGRCD
jgi:WD40 repeat protein